MKFKNKIFYLIMAILVFFSVSSCSNEDNTPNTTTPSYNENTDYYSETVYETVYDNVSVQDVSNNAATTQNSNSVTNVPETTFGQSTPTKEDVQNIPPVTPSPTQPNVNSNGVATYSTTLNSLEHVVFYPGEILNNKKTYPVLVWANGTAVSYDFYSSLLEQIAKGGYIVVANTEKMSADGSAQISSIDFIISENENQNSPLYKKINTSKIGAMGHSQGGRSAVNAAATDSRIDAVMSLAGSNYKEEAEKLSTPVFFITGTKDKIVDAATWVKPAYDVVTGPAVYASLNGGNHITCKSNPEKYSSYIISWFDFWLKGNSAAEDIFKDGGTLANDSNFVDFACKGI